MHNSARTFPSHVYLIIRHWPSHSARNDDPQRCDAQPFTHKRFPFCSAGRSEKARIFFTFKQFLQTNLYSSTIQSIVSLNRFKLLRNTMSNSEQISENARPGYIKLAITGSILVQL